MFPRMYGLTRKCHAVKHWFVNTSIDWVIDWFVSICVYWLIDWLTDWLIDLSVDVLRSTSQIIRHKLMAAFRYPHRTRPNSGPDQIMLVLKISTEPTRSWCCLHIHKKFWSAAAVDNSGPISVSQRMSQQCLQIVCVVKTWRFHSFILFSFTFG